MEFKKLMPGAVFAEENGIRLLIELQTFQGKVVLTIYEAEEVQQKKEDDNVP